MVAHEAPRQRPQPAELQLLEEDLAKRLLLPVAEQNLLTRSARDDVHTARASPIAKQKLACLSHVNQS